MKNHHGGEVYDKNIKFDFSININPLGMPNEIKKSIVENIDKFEIYPDSECLQLRKKISQVENIPLENIVCGNGADDLIFRIAIALKPQNVLVLAPTFSEYEKSLEKCHIKYYYLKEELDFKIKSDILEYITKIDVFYLCNPNNPTGILIDDNLMNLIVEKCIEENVILIVDESFLDFTINGKSFKSYLDLNLNLIILKSFTKIYSMAGIRLGYALCSNENLCQKIFDCGQAWSVSSVAQICGLSALDCTDYINITQKYVQKENNFLVSNLVGLGTKVYQSDANYILIKSDIDLYNLLLKENILIRSCYNYIGLGKSYFRIAIKNHEENQILINTFRKIFNRS